MPDDSTVPGQRTGTRRFYGRTDLGNAELLRDAFGDEVRYVREVGRWYAYRTGRWIDDYDMSARWVAERVGRLLRDLAAGIADPREKKAAMRWARDCESRARASAMLYMAASLPGMHVGMADFDADPWLLNCANGTVDLHTGELLAHRPERLLTKSTGVDFEPAASAPEFHAMFARVQPAAEMREFLERYLGLSLIGAVIEHVMAVMIGSGANGKTTLCEAVKGTLGEYAATVSPAAVIQSMNGAGPSDAVANMRGQRLCLLAETDAGRRLSEATVKLLTGGDTIRARRLYENEIEFRPSHTMVMFTNHRPEVTTGGDALWRRIRVVPFDVTIPATEQDRMLGETLALERAGILAWLVASCLDYQSHGLPYPDVMREAGEDYRAEEDHMAQFLDDCTLSLPGYRIDRTRLRAAYQDWCEAAGYRPLSAKRFSASLREHNVKDAPKGRTGTRAWMDITLRSDGT